MTTYIPSSASPRTTLLEAIRCGLLPWPRDFKGTDCRLTLLHYKGRYSLGANVQYATNAGKRTIKYRITVTEEKS